MKHCSACGREYRGKGSLVYLVGKGTTLERVRVCSGCEARAIRILSLASIPIGDLGTPATPRQALILSRTAAQALEDFGLEPAVRPVPKRRRRPTATRRSKRGAP